MILIYILKSISVAGHPLLQTGSKVNKYIT